MYAGEGNEFGRLEDVFGHMAHPYQGLFKSIPTLDEEKLS